MCTFILSMMYVLAKVNDEPITPIHPILQLLVVTMRRKFFGKQCYKGGRNDNPSVKEFVVYEYKVLQLLNLSQEIVVGRENPNHAWHIDNNPLPKCRRSSKNGKI